MKHIFTLNLFKFTILAAVIILTAGCNSDLLFLANFNNDTPGQPPSQSQEKGKVFTDGLAQWVVVSYLNDSTNELALLQRPQKGGKLASLQGVMERTYSSGDFGIIAALNIPSGSETVSFSLESPAAAPNAYEGFLHIDFLTNNRLRIDDHATAIFGTFPYDKTFVFSMLFHLEPAGSYVEVCVTGNGAEGSHRYDIRTPYALMSQFQAARFWFGFDWKGRCYIDDFMITKHRKK